MKRVCMILGMSAALCGVQAFALELDQTTRSKAIAATAPAAEAKSAQHLTLQLPDLQGGVDADGRTFSGACSARSDLCYDATNGRIVLRSTRNWMPAIGGLTPEHISLKKDRITFRYSFK